jgi:hypothetical protein
MSLGWSYLPPLKGTAFHNFAIGRLKNGIAEPRTNEALTLLTKLRGEMLDAMRSFDNSEESVRKGVIDYLEAFEALVNPPASLISTDAPPIDPTAAGAATEPGALPEGTSTTTPAAAPVTTEPATAEKLKSVCHFKWFDNVSAAIMEVDSAHYEKLCVITNYGLWLAKHATKLAQTKSDDEEAGKQIYRSSRLSASIFDYVLKQELPSYPYSPNTDMDERIMEARVHQLLAEAQEVTIERGRRKGNSPELIAGLAHDNFIRFTSALNKISSVDEQFVGDFRRYLKFKIKFHESYAFCFTGQSLFKEEKIGEAIKAYEQSKAACYEAELAAKEYVKKSTRKLNMTFQNFLDNPIYLQLGKEIITHSEKATRENGFIYHQKVPITDMDMLPPKALVSVEQFSPPPLNAEFWAKSKFHASRLFKKGESMAADKASSSDANPVSPLGNDQTGAKKGEFCSIQ